MGGEQAAGSDGLRAVSNRARRARVVPEALAADGSPRILGARMPIRVQSTSATRLQQRQCRQFLLRWQFKPSPGAVTVTGHAYATSYQNPGRPGTCWSELAFDRS
jgi:hypothetical protein